MALGSNLQGPLSQLRRAARALRGAAVAMHLSSIYRSDPVGGPEGQPVYLNAVAALDFAVDGPTPEALLEALLTIEREQGRVRRERWGPRTIDLDLLAMGDLRRNTAGLTLPHPRMMERAFVLAPLCEVAPLWRHPETGESACRALERVGLVGVHRTRLGWRPR